MRSGVKACFERMLSTLPKAYSACSACCPEHTCHCSVSFDLKIGEDSPTTSRPCQAVKQKRSSKRSGWLCVCRKCLAICSSHPYQAPSSKECIRWAPPHLATLAGEGGAKHCWRGLRGGGGGVSVHACFKQTMLQTGMLHHHLWHASWRLVVTYITSDLAR